MLNDEQKKLRRTGVGGSDVAAVAGRSRYATPLDIYKFKIGEEEDVPEDEDYSVPMWLGKELEPIYRKRFMQQTGLDVIVPDKTFRHSKYHWMISNVDGIIPSEKAILEIKHVGFRSIHKWGADGSDEIPEEGLMQSSHYRKGMEEHGIEKAYVFTCLGGQEFRTYIYNKTDILEKRIIEIEQTFWVDHVQKLIPPDPQHRADALKLWPASTEDKIVADEKTKEVIDNIKTIRQKVKELEAEKDQLETNLYAFLKESSLLEDEWGQKLATWRNENFNRFDTTAFKEKFPDLYKEFTKHSLIRKLRIA